MATMHGDPPHVQGLHRGGPWIPSTLSLRVSPRQTGLGGLLSHMAKMESAQWHRSFLAIRHARCSCLRERRWHPPPPGPRVQCKRLLLHQKSLDTLRSFILYFLWTERCQKHFDNQYSSRKILQQAWVAIVEVGMAIWKAINSLRSARDSSIQARIDQAFRAEWCHLGIFGVDKVTIMWCFLPPLYLLNFFNVWWGCCLPPILGVSSKYCTHQTKRTVIYSFSGPIIFCCYMCSWRASQIHHLSAT